MRDELLFHSANGGCLGAFPRHTMIIYKLETAQLGLKF